MKPGLLPNHQPPEPHRQKEQCFLPRLELLLPRSILVIICHPLVALGGIGDLLVTESMGGGSVEAKLCRVLNQL